MSSPHEIAKSLRELSTGIRRVAQRKEVQEKEETELRDIAALLDSLTLELVQPASLGGQYPSNGPARFTWAKHGERFRVRVVLPEYKPCERCGGPQCAAFDVSPGGYSAGTEYRHNSTCPALRCEHGVLWADLCQKCEEQERKACQGDDE